MALTTKRVAFVGKEVSVMLGFRGQLMKELAAKGHTIYAFAIDYDDASERTIRAMGFIPVRYSMQGYSLNPWNDLKSCWQLYQAFKQYRIELSFCYFAKPAIYGTLAAWAARVPERIAKLEGLGRTFTEGTHKPSWRMRLAKRVQCYLFKLALPKTTALILLNDDDKQDLKRFCGINLPNTTVLGGIGVCLDKFRFSEVPLEPINFVFVGRLLNEKGIRYFLDAAQRLKKQYPQVTFTVVGAASQEHGVSQKELNAYVKAGVIEHAGQVNDVVPYIEKSSVFVLPSYYREGLPRSTQEALAVGRPVITTDSPGCRETVKNGINGYLVPKHNEQALEKAMEQMITHPSVLPEMGRASRKLAEARFNVLDVNKKLITILNL